MQVGTVVEYPVGQEYIKGQVLRIVRAGSWQRVLYTVSIARCLHEQSVRVTRKMLQRARRDNETWGQGMRPPPASLTERHVISADTFDHLLESLVCVVHEFSRVFMCFRVYTYHFR